MRRIAGSPGIAPQGPMRQIAASDRVDQRRVAKTKAQRDWYRRKTRQVILAVTPISKGVRQMLVDDGVIFEHESTAGRPSLTGHCGHGWTSSLPRPVAIDPSRTLSDVRDGFLDSYARALGAARKGRPLDRLRKLIRLAARATDVWRLVRIHRRHRVRWVLQIGP